MGIDRITLSVIRNGLNHTAEEMSEALKHSSYSPIIREMLDYSCAIFDGRGRLLAQAENIPAQLGSMGFALLELIARWPADTIEPGDVFICNDPYRGGTHTPDIHIFIPVFYDGEILAYTGSIAHHTDVGGPHPGTEGFANPSIFAEGVRIPPLKLYAADIPNGALLELIRANVREPVATTGDLRAQVAACRTGASRILALARRYGRDTVEAAIDETIAYAERRVRQCLLYLPDGIGEADGYLDDDGVSDCPVRIHATVTKSRSDITFDLTGTDPVTAGGMNVPRAAASSAALFVLRCLIDADIPQNEGCFLPLTIILPNASLVSPTFPAAVSLRHLAVQRIADTILRAISNIAPDRISAGSFVGFSSISSEVTNPQTGAITVVQDDLGGGTGATCRSDGLDGVDVHLSNVGILPIEVCEIQYPVRILTTEYITDSGGPGEYRGGLGIRRVYQFLEPSREIVIYTEQSRPEYAPWGIAGGSDGTCARIRLCREGGAVLEVRKTTLPGRTGDTVIMETGGGGGFGDPRQRERQFVERDVREGKISRWAAAELYGYSGDAMEHDADESDRREVYQL